MPSRGDVAPAFELPAIVGGKVEHVALEDYLGEDIIILAFYPGDFNPACSGGRAGLADLDLFRMQKDVTVLAISGDSVHSHHAFAGEYDLHVPLLADVRGDVAAKYGARVGDADAGYLTERAVVIIGPDGKIEYTWRADGLRTLPNIDRVREAVDGVSSGNAAEARYRVGHAHYLEGRRAFTSGMAALHGHEWMMAQGDFSQAFDEFQEAADHFNTARRFAEDETAGTHYERAEHKAEALWQAAEWLADAASAHASGEETKGKRVRVNAEEQLERSRDIPEPPDPDEFPLRGRGDPGRPPPVEEDEPFPSGAEAGDEPAVRSGPDFPRSPDSARARDDAGIDEAELAEITAELEEQNLERSPDDGDAGEENDGSDAGTAGDGDRSDTGS